MTSVVYTAKRGVIAGHAISSVYTLPIVCKDIVPGKERSIEMNQAMGGARETFFYYMKRTYDCTVRPLQLGGALDALKEFLDSVSGGETFTFDPYGGDSAAGFTAILTSDPYTEMPDIKIGQGGSNDYFVIQFSVREL